MRVVLADDHPVVREGYRRLLERAGGIEVVAEVEDGEGAYRVFCELLPDVLVIDINLPGISGIEAARRVLAREPAAKVLIFSMHEDVVFASRALQAGARGYITKSSAPDVLVEALRAVARGKMYISHDVAQRLAAQVVPGGNVAFNELSAREFEVFRLLAEGNSVADIARILSLSPKTIANYQSLIKQKLDADTSAQMVWIALRSGVISGAAD
jgi:DNA-binding NarL/FixJ family response regulator